MRIVDLELNIDGLLLEENQSIEEVIESIKINSVYPITYRVLFEETL